MLRARRAPDRRAVGRAVHHIGGLLLDVMHAAIHHTASSVDGRRADSKSLEQFDGLHAHWRSGDAVLERESEKVRELFVVVLAARLHDRDVEDERRKRQLLRFRKFDKLGLPMAPIVEDVALNCAKARYVETPSPDQGGPGSAGPQGRGAE